MDDTIVDAATIVRWLHTYDAKGPRTRGATLIRTSRLEQRDGTGTDVLLWVRRATLGRQLLLRDSNEGGDN